MRPIRQTLLTVRRSSAFESQQHEGNIPTGPVEVICSPWSVQRGLSSSLPTKAMPS